MVNYSMRQHQQRDNHCGKSEERKQTRQKSSLCHVAVGYFVLRKVVKNRINTWALSIESFCSANTVAVATIDDHQQPGCDRNKDQNPSDLHRGQRHGHGCQSLRNS